jgi:hypothetical protein
LWCLLKFMQKCNPQFSDFKQYLKPFPSIKNYFFYISPIFRTIFILPNNKLFD